MKKGICIMLILVLSLSIGLANVPTTTNQNSTLLSTQEMLTTVGGQNMIFCDAQGRLCGTLDLWIISITVCGYDFIGVCSMSISI
jgi:hypothetical protein